MTDSSPSLNCTFRRATVLALSRVLFGASEVAKEVSFRMEGPGDFLPEV